MAANLAAAERVMIMPKSSFAVIWRRIADHTGETYHTKRGLEFTYEISGDTFRSSRTAYKTDRSQFEKAYSMVPVDGPGVITNVVRGPSYVWAMLHDMRISRGE